MDQRGLKESEQGQVQKDKERLKTGEGNLYVFYMLFSTMKCEPYFPIIYVCMKFMWNDDMSCEVNLYMSMNGCQNMKCMYDVWKVLWICMIIAWL